MECVLHSVTSPLLTIVVVQRGLFGSGDGEVVAVPLLEPFVPYHTFFVDDPVTFDLTILPCCSVFYSTFGD